MILFEIAEDQNIDIDYINTTSIASLSIPGAIAIDLKKMSDLYDFRCHLAHELGHCITNSFYNQYIKYDLKEKREYKANKWAIKTLIPFDSLSDALYSGIDSVWELAEYFEVTEDFIYKALELYQEQLLYL